MNDHLNTRTRWLALVILCVGDLMIVVDTTVVNVALPSIRTDLHFSQTSLAWVVNAYMLTFGGFLLLAGRLGDLFGQRRLFLSGTAAFTSERAKAMGVFGFVMAGGGSIGVLMGGVLTDLVGWHWIFLVNLPIGVGVTLTGLKLLPAVQTGAEQRRLDVAGAVAITGAMVLAVYAIVNGNTSGWTSGQTLGLLGAAVIILAGFVAWESRVAVPLMPLGIFRHRNLSAANVVGVLWAASMFALFFLSALYLQLVLGYSPLQVGLAYLPGNLLMMAFSLGVSAKLVMRYGFRVPLVLGLLAAAIALVWLARAPVHGSFLVDVLPSMILFGIGAGLAFNPVLMAAMSDVEPQDSGLASGIVNTAFMMGGALGLAVLASVASARTQHLAASGHGTLTALTGGYHVAFAIGAVFAVGAATIGATLLRTRSGAVEAHRPEPALQAA